MADNKKVLNDDELDMVSGGMNLLYTGEKIEKYNGLMNDSVPAENSDLIYRRTSPNNGGNNNISAPKGMIC